MCKDVEKKVERKDRQILGTTLDKQKPLLKVFET
jgi:hypothetical protein